MDADRFDALTRALGGISRRRALRLAGATALASVVTPLLPQQAEALSVDARRRCRRKGGIPLDHGTCHCG
jgi:hypothetical protein